MADLPRSERPSTSKSEQLSRRIQALLDEDARVSVREISDRLHAPKSTVHDCMREMDLVKLSARWVPRILTSEMKQNRHGICQSNLQMVEEYGGWEKFLPLIVTGDETWIPFFDPPSKQVSKVWMKKGSDPPVKAKRERSVGSDQCFKDITMMQICSSFIWS